MASKTSRAVTRPAGDRLSTSFLKAPGWGRRVGWLVLAGAWTLLFLALATFSSADWPSRSVAMHNDPPANLLGATGALVAHWVYIAAGPGIWVAMAAFAWMLGLIASGRVVTHPLVRLLGVSLLTLCVSALLGWWLPVLSPVVGAEGGVLPAYVFDELSVRFPPLAVAGLLLLGLLVGAIVSMDELVFAFPSMVRRAFTLSEPLTRLDWKRLGEHLPRGRQPVLRSAGAVLDGGDMEGAVVVSPVLSGSKVARRKVNDRDLEVADMLARSARGGATLADHDEEETLDTPSRSARGGRAGAVADHEDDAEAIDERGDDHDGEDGEFDSEFDAEARNLTAAEDSEEDDDADESPADETDSAEDEGDDGVADHTAGTETSAAAKETPKQLSAEELRARISKLPVRMANRRVEQAREEDIPRAVDYSGYQFPPLEMLEDPEGNFSETMEAFVRDQAQVLTEALRTYQIDGEVVGIESGPVVTLYSVELAPGTRVMRLETISKDIARSLQAPNIRIIPNMVGRTAVGIEVPNRQKERVRLKELMSGGQAQSMVLPMFLGKDSAGEPMVVDLTRMPHMLIAGTTGSGKSVCMNTIIMGWLYTKRPDELKMVLVDPKMVEMSQFSDIPHLMCPVVTDMSKAAGILEWAVEKMEERYELLKDAGVRDIRSYNDLGEEELIVRFNPQNDLERAKIPKKLPYLVFVIDELADLMMTNKEVEHSIVRIAQKARAVGIHLIVATQRPQANVVTGLIKSNMPCRISFKVASGMDSRIVLDQKGAELLLGQGDMLVLTPSSSELRRAQGTLVTDGETRSVARFLKQVAAPSFERQLIAIRGPGARGGEVSEGDGGDPGMMERDPLFDKAVEVMIESGRGSVSLLQRRLAIGYGRASRLVDQMGMAGILSDHKGSVAREVLITLEDWQRMKAMEAEDLAEAEEVDPIPPSQREARAAADAGRGSPATSTARSAHGNEADEDDESDEPDDSDDTDERHVRTGGADAKSLATGDLEYVEGEEDDHSGVPDEFDGEFRQ
ncbi:MAG: DNA translocase FtsK 4TM domain-containing protein [Phycisphaeraceae bacterium]|nr:DNA translocase FtsK 4TM domain-containing protein [Phycisphaeraceae bacterium]